MRELDSNKDNEYFETMDQVLEDTSLSSRNVVENFPRFASVPALSRFMARCDIFRQIIEVPGVIVDAGVFHGASLFGWAKLSAILEPTNHTRRVVGFDTFGGFPAPAKQDGTSVSAEMKLGGYKGSTRAELEASVAAFDINRPLPHIPKIELVEGDLCQTAPDYLTQNPQLVVSLLHLDLDLYAPTRAALDTFVPRMPKGAIIVFDELNSAFFPGETLALLETLGINQCALRRLPFHPWISYLRL